MIDTTVCFAIRMEGIKRAVGYIPEIRYLIRIPHNTGIVQ